MLDIFPLPIFPQGALTSSVITTTWVGIFVVSFFNLRFGWVLSGMIVPGYLVPLLLIKPWSAGVIIFEGIITYLIVWLFSEKFSRLGYWSSLFGRDRFFALVLVSIFVRLFFDAWLLPIAGEWITDTLSINFDYRNNLHSFGLIIVSLIANQFWKTGVVRGIFPLLVTMATTFAIVRYGLMEFTNFTLSNLNYIYEDIASSILASPKAYIILLAAAYIASRMNLRYGWEYNGILIPALLALQWYQPSKILISFVEALIILWLARGVLMMPIFANLNIEGARKTLLFFNIGFLYKVLLGYFIIWQFPDVKITDAYGFGYLLSTLMAVKMHDKDIAIRFTKSTVQTSLIAVIIASFIGFALTLASAYFSEKMNPVDINVQKDIHHLNVSLNDQIRDDKLILYRSRLLRNQTNVLLTENNQFSNGLRKIKDYLRTRDKQYLRQAIEYFNPLGFELSLIDNRYLYLREGNIVKGWGLYVIDTRAENKLLVEVPYPLDESGVLEAGISLFQQMNAFAFASGGTLKTLSIDNSSDVLANRQSFFHLFHEIMSQDDVIQIRHQQHDDNKLLVKEHIPDSVNIKTLKEMIKTFDFVWGESKEINRQRDASASGFAELYITSEAIRHIISHQFYQQQTMLVQKQQQRIDGYLQEWILNSKGILAESGSNLYIPPTEEELLFFDEEIITPLLAIIDEYKQVNAWNETLQSRLNRVMGNATAFNYNLVHYYHSKTHQEYIILYEQETSKDKHYWGTYIFRLSESEPYIIEIPRPGYEVNSFEYASSLFEQLNARALLIAGSHPHANVDGSADMVQFANKSSLFTLINQVIMREHFNEQLFVFSVRAFGFREDVELPDTDILISLSHGIRSDAGISDKLKALLNLFDRNNFSYQFVQGKEETSGYEIGSIPQSLYALISQNKVFGVIWLSPFIRKSYRQKHDDFIETGHFNSLDIPTLEVDVQKYLADNVIRFGLQKQAVNVPETFRLNINKYLSTRDFITLTKSIGNANQYSYQRLIDKDTRQSFLSVKDKNQRIAMLINLSSIEQNSVISINDETTIGVDIERFINSKTAWLILGDLP